MKNIIFIVQAIFCSCTFAYCQDTAREHEKDSIVMSSFSFVNNQFLDSLHDIVYRKFHERGLDTATDLDFKTVSLFNKDSSQFVSALVGPDAGPSLFYTIGLCRYHKDPNYGKVMGRVKEKGFSLGNDICFGDTLEKLWPKLNLFFFKNFTYRGQDYFYYEFMGADEIPHKPRRIVYFKFANKILVEVGYGRGVDRYNPMFHD